ncbi:MAG: DUF4957 domain-containing protein [Prevotella sp.]|nr:DUF4957 domain-containing protein [Prevotella sp.]
MRKSNLLGGALLLAALFVNTSCKEIFGNMDLSGDTTVSSYVAINTASKTAAPAEEFTLSITKIGDGTVTWSSSDPAIAEVQGAGLSAKVIAKKSGNATITANVAAAGNYQAGSAKCAVAVRVNDFEQLKTELAAEGTEVKVYLADAAAIEMDEDVDITGKKVAIIGGTNTAMTVKKAFQIDNDFALSNVKIDFSEQASYFVGFKNATEEVVKIGDVTFENIVAKNMKQPLFASKQKNYLMNNISITNSIVEMGSNKNVIDLSSGSSAYNINFEKSTIYATVSHSTATFKSQSGQKIIDLDESGIQTFNLLNSTFYNLTYNANFFQHRQNSQTWLKFVVKENIFVNCGKSNQVIQGLNGGGTSKNPTFDVDSNVFNFDGADQSETEVSPNSDMPNKNNIAAVITFKDAAKGDFTQSDANAGDPRWIK